MSARDVEAYRCMVAKTVEQQVFEGVVKSDEQGQQNYGDLAMVAQGSSPTEIAAKKVETELELDFICLPSCISATTNLSMLLDLEWDELKMKEMQR